ncbi:MAG TPA: hypothetical protein DD473_06745 [Planctomycetaceae bacterium]|nr:hypothetical protein [Planctomycetaceae bacterium]|tara:strand:+ start:425 stop:634 length:210 start_codon:yes stop_codon:yes gene_type:complete
MIDLLDELLDKCDEYIFLHPESSVTEVVDHFLSEADPLELRSDLRIQVCKLIKINRLLKVIMVDSSDIS